MQNPLYGRPLFAETKQELDTLPAERSAAGIGCARSVRNSYGGSSVICIRPTIRPPQSYLFDLTADPNAEHNILTPPLKQRYDEEIIEHLHLIGDFYGYKPGVGSLLASSGR